MGLRLLFFLKHDHVEFLVFSKFFLGLSKDPGQSHSSLSGVTEVTPPLKLDSEYFMAGMYPLTPDA